MDTDLQQVLNRLSQRGVTLGQVRVVEREMEWVQVRNGRVQTCTHSLSRGMGIRVLAGGWGYAASDQVTDPVALADRAVDLAMASSPLAWPEIPMGEMEPQVGTWRSPVEIDPFEVPLDEKVGRLMDATGAMGKLAVAEGHLVCLRRRTHFVSTEGSDIRQEQLLSGVSVGATAVAHGHVQIRTWPKSMEGNLAGRGWEHILTHDLNARAAEVGEEARQLTSAPKCPEGVADILLDGAQLSLQIHESCGHPVEGDRVLGEEMSLAGGSFLQPEFLGERYGSELVHLYAEGQSEGAAGSFGWDDEGTPACSVDLVKDGVFQSWLSGRESSSRLGCTNSAAMRAETWSDLPIVRMVNVNLAPGNAGSLDDLIADTERGFLLSRNRAWSIDQLRLNFQFGCEAAYEIVDGEIGQMYRDPVYTGKTPGFWSSCDAICGPEAWEQWGWAFCGKGDPAQIMHVSHGCAPARFRQVNLK